MSMIAYLITNVVNGRKYIGITRCSLADRWRRHCSEARTLRRKGLMQYAIRKYGADSFTIEPVASARTWENLCLMEAELIKQWGTKKPFGYNLTDGGEGIAGYRYDPEVVAKIAAKQRGRHHTDEAKRLIGLAGIGRKKSDAGRAAISAARKGKPLSVEHRRKLAAAKLGKKMPPRSREHTEKIAAGIRATCAKRKRESNGLLF